MSRKMISLLPIALILILILVLYLSGIYQKINFNWIQYEHLQWKTYAAAHPFLSAVYFISIYILSVVLVIPDSTVLTLLGGFLFPLPLAIIYACLSETIGATLFFLATRLAFRYTLDTQKAEFLHKAEKKIQAHQTYYMLFFRLSHLLPFWLINLAASVVRIRTGIFIWTTLVGVLPLTYFIAEGGASLSKYFETHTHFNIREVFTPEVKVALILLACLSLLPLAVQRLKFKKRR